jgi:hypothetical protein
MRIQELIAVLSDHDIQNRFLTAKSTGTCKICGGPANEFRSLLAKMEYGISGICEKCQEYYYLNENDH